MNDDKLSVLLSEFARTMLTDFPIQKILDHLVDRIVEVLDVTGAGVTLISPGFAPHYIAASNDAALTYERLQTELAEGPCRLSWETGEAVVVADLRRETRFPRFTRAALSAGLAACFTFPLRHNDGRLGALDLYRDGIGPLSEPDMVVAQTLADVVAAYLLNAQAREEARHASDQFREGALRDPLTGLANRTLLQQRLEHSARRARRSHSRSAVLFADLDRFKQVNDTYGHEAGDQLLVAVAHRLSVMLRPGDTLARVSGDEFVFLCEDLSSVQDIEVLAARIVDAFVEPFEVLGRDLTVSVSVGMAFAGPGESLSNQQIVDADMAMYQAKRKGGAGHQVIDVREARQSSNRNSLEQELREAFSARRLAVHYQPVVRGTDGLVTGVEALLRWEHPDRGPIATADMISLAEENGLIIDIGSWVLRTACADRQAFLGEHPGTPLVLAVNVSARQLLGAGFTATVREVVTATGIPPESLVLEMTEGIFIGDAERALAVLWELKHVGVKLALDDFGTGYCALNYLLRFPVDIVKIDQSFVRSLHTERHGGAIVSAITRLAHVLDLTVVAEGVETLEQYREIVAVGCDSIQGFLFARPMSAAQLSDVLAAGDGGAPVRLPALAVAGSATR